jgi:hypothetical protein
MEKFHERDIHEALRGLNLKTKQVEYVKGFLMGQNMGGLQKREIERSLLEFKRNKHDMVTSFQAEKIHKAIHAMINPEVAEPAEIDAREEHLPDHESNRFQPPADENLTRHNTF